MISVCNSGQLGDVVVIVEYCDTELIHETATSLTVEILVSSVLDKSGDALMSVATNAHKTGGQSVWLAPCPVLPHCAGTPVEHDCDIHGHFCA